MTAALTLERPPPMTPPTPRPARRPELMGEQVLAALPSAVGTAQRFVRHTLEQGGLPGMADAAEAVVTELVSDAVARTGIPVEHPGYLDLYGKHLNLVMLRLLVLGDHVLVEVRDTGPVPPGPLNEEAPDARMRTRPGAGDVGCDRAPIGGNVARGDLEILPVGDPARFRPALSRAIPITDTGFTLDPADDAVPPEDRAQSRTGGSPP